MQPRLDRAPGTRYTPAHSPAEQVHPMSDETAEARIARLEAEVAELRASRLTEQQIRDMASEQFAATYREMLRPIKAQLDVELAKIETQIDILNQTLQYVRFAWGRVNDAPIDEDAPIELRLSLRELLRLYEESLQRHPDLSLADFARLHNVNYRSLVTVKNRPEPKPKRRRTKRKT